ncbi:peptide/nickel transport system substrate-binding protein [Acetitomaculum ruminis DSM 5522]|uniref:Peptide/nickel transport system substrate-binding protein n=1 Tax=Acetitomaculum ruminis DSM 5522 TaxID=1120918 RepID=A0A1I0YT86_9FIRM|nr:ABC transporter substrate-binding protein [Acetitomaculum ruminis]SFB15640.1 peptide/nickel transport system substrate-binding protein [Acetitomaculum ruminis DSM 5522]
MKRRFLSIMLAVMLASSLAACGNSGSDANSKSNKSASEDVAKDSSDSQKADSKNDDSDESINIYIGNGVFDSSMDPVKGFMSYGYPFVNEALIQADVNSNYVADLATDWSVSDDALKYTFNLKKDVKFSDGSDFTAEDVVFTYNKVKENQANNENADLSRLSKVEALDDYTVEFTLDKPYSPFIDIVAQLQIVPSDAYDEQKFETAPIGTGAYKVAQYDANQQIILTINENYWGETPDIEQVNIISMSQDTAYSNACSGQMDVVMVTSTYINEEIEGMKLHKLETMDVRNISLPTLTKQKKSDSKGKEYEVGNDVTSDLAVRKAISIGINRQEIINAAFNGEGVPAVNFTDNLPWASTDDYEDNQVDEAKKILEEAGWKDSDGDGIREKGDLKCAFEVIAPGNDEDRYKLATAFAENVKELGVEVKVRNESWDVAVEEENTTPIVWGWGQYSPTVLYSLFDSEMFLEAQYANVSGLTSKECDEAIEKAFNATNLDDAYAAWKEAQKISDAQYPYLYLVNIEHSYFINENLDISEDTQIPHPHGHGTPIICNLKDWVLN